MWIDTERKDTMNMANHIPYEYRIETLEDVLIAKTKALFNLKGSISQMEIDRRYALCHSKEQYLSIGKQLQDKIAYKDYQLIDGHLCVEL